MLKQIVELGVTLNKTELQTISGGGRSSCYNGNGYFDYNGRCMPPQVDN